MKMSSNKKSFFEYHSLEFKEYMANKHISSSLLQMLTLISYGMINLYGLDSKNDIYIVIKSIHYMYYDNQIQILWNNDKKIAYSASFNDFKIYNNKLDLFPTVYIDDKVDIYNFKYLLYVINLTYYDIHSKFKKDAWNLNVRNGFYDLSFISEYSSFEKSLIILECEDILSLILNINNANIKVAGCYKRLINNLVDYPYSYLDVGYENEINLIRNLYKQDDFRNYFINNFEIKRLFDGVLGSGSYDRFVNLLDKFSESIKDDNYYLSSTIYCNLRNDFVLRYLKIKYS